jgi:flavin reductase (DIM6/NTAB) family NADH-FMN oxidoreductase RutF
MEAELKKKVLRKITYGMWVISAAAGDDVEASSITWVMQGSFKPPLVVVGVRADTHLRTVIEKGKAFALHLLSASQKDLAEAFTKPTKVEGGKIGGVAWKPGATGAPLLEGFSAWLEARVTDVVSRGDHVQFVAEVVEAGMSSDEEPLALATTGWNYGG